MVLSDDVERFVVLRRDATSTGVRYPSQQLAFVGGSAFVVLAAPAGGGLLEVRPDRIRLRWIDPMLNQLPSGQWFDLEDLDLALQRPVKSARQCPARG